jgi:hypothetical protein
MATKSSEIQAAERAARDAVSAAKAAQAFYAFFKIHCREGLLSCESNKRALEDYLDRSLLEVNVTNLEIAYLALEKSLAKSATSAPPPAPPPPPQPAPQSEDERLRALLKEHRGDPKGAANAARAILKTNAVHASNSSRRVLPPEYDRKRLLKMSGAEMRDLKNRYGFDAINARLAETATK